jgi:hypothetical protein
MDNENLNRSKWTNNYTITTTTSGGSNWDYYYWPYYVGDPITVPSTTFPNTVGTGQVWPNKKQYYDWEEMLKVIPQRIEKETKMESTKDLLSVYEITIVDKRECSIVGVQKVVAVNENVATAMLMLTDEQKAKLAKNEIEFIIIELGSFTPIKDKE